MSKTKSGPISAGRLKSFIERAERVIEERKAVSGDLRDIFVEAKGAGYNPKIMRRIIAERARDAAELAAEQDEMDTYRHALGMAVELVRNGLSLREAERKTGASKSSIHRALSVPQPSQPASPGHDPDTGEIIESTDKEVDLPGVDAGRRSEPSSPAVPRGPSPIGAVNPDPPPGREPPSDTGKGGDPAPIHESCGAHTGGGVEVSAAPPVPRADATAPPQDLDLDAGSIPPFLDRRSQAVRAA